MQRHASWLILLWPECKTAVIFGWAFLYCFIILINPAIISYVLQLLFLKRGGELIYAGPLGLNSCELIKYFEVRSCMPWQYIFQNMWLWVMFMTVSLTCEYFFLQAVEGVPKIRPGYNPAAWMLDVTSSVEESRLGVDFAEVYRRSNLFQYENLMNSDCAAFIQNYMLLDLTTIFLCLRHNKELVESLSRPSTNSKELNFPTKYSQTFFEQFLTCLWKQNLSYWRNPQYTAVRFFYTVIISLMLGTICWRFGAKRFPPFS